MLFCLSYLMEAMATDDQRDLLRIAFSLPNYLDTVLVSMQFLINQWERKVAKMNLQVDVDGQKTEGRIVIDRGGSGRRGRRGPG